MMILIVGARKFKPRSTLVRFIVLLHTWLPTISISLYYLHAIGCVIFFFISRTHHQLNENHLSNLTKMLTPAVDVFAFIVFEFCRERRLYHLLQFQTKNELNGDSSMAALETKDGYFIPPGGE